MSTITLWILVSITSRGAAVVDRFADVAECRRVQEIIKESPGGNDRPPLMRCIQAKVVNP